MAFFQFDFILGMMSCAPFFCLSFDVVGCAIFRGYFSMNFRVIEIGERRKDTWSCRCSLFREVEFFFQRIYL